MHLLGLVRSFPLRVIEKLKDSRPNLLQHLAATGCAFVALWVRWLFDPVLEDRQPLSLVFAAVALTVWLSGYKAALTGTVMGYLGADYLFTDPRGAIAINTASQWFNFFTYLLSCAIVIAFGESLRRASERSRQYAAQLEAHRQALQDSDRNKDHFLATLAHELRTPLMAVSNVAQLLQRKSASYPELQHVSRILTNQTKHVTRLVDDLLDLSRIRTGQIHIHTETLSLHEVVSTVVDSARPNCEAASLSLDLQLSKEPIIVQGDFARLSQVFTNLIANAIRYTPPGGKISVSLQREGAFAVTRVRDTGIGIAPDMTERIFDLFEQTPQALERDRTGLGIGLALVRKLLKLHGGTVEARSEGPNRGSEFIVRLPAKNLSTHQS